MMEFSRPSPREYLQPPPSQLQPLFGGLSQSSPGPTSIKKSHSAQIHFSYVSSRQEPVTLEFIGSTFSKFGSEIDISQKKADYNRVRYFDFPRSNLK